MIVLFFFSFKTGCVFLAKSTDPVVAVTHCPPRELFLLMVKETPVLSD